MLQLQPLLFQGSMSLQLMQLTLLLAGIVSVECTTATLSNTVLPSDQHGEKLLTGEASILQHKGEFFLYFNDWGACPGIDCCNSAIGCSTCCFQDPLTLFPRGCESGTPNTSDPYGVVHQVHAYKTKDFEAFIYLGVALPTTSRRPGIEFRPHVVYNERTQLFLMWFEDRGPGLKGYSIATSESPEGPFSGQIYNVVLPGNGRTGDFDIFVDDDGGAYHVRTGFDVVKLNENYTGPDQLMSSFHPPDNGEAPVMFKRSGMYYVLSGSGCCACIGGASILVMMAESLRGPWNYTGDIGSNPGKFDPHSQENYVTRAQASFVLKAGSLEEPEYIWCGNQWNSGLQETPPGARNHDLLYWTKLRFDADGRVQQVIYQESCTFELPGSGDIFLA